MHQWKMRKKMFVRKAITTQMLHRHILRVNRQIKSAKCSYKNTLQIQKKSASVSNETVQK